MDYQSHLDTNSFPTEQQRQYQKLHHQQQMMMMIMNNSNNNYTTENLRQQQTNNSISNSEDCPFDNDISSLSANQIASYMTGFDSNIAGTTSNIDINTNTNTVTAADLNNIDASSDLLLNLSPPSIDNNDLDNIALPLTPNLSTTTRYHPNDYSNNSSNSASRIPSKSKSISTTIITDKDKKKEQNRAAQKAFRERKENELKILQSKLMESQNDRIALQNQINELKNFNNEMIQTNNKLLSSEDVFTTLMNQTAISPPSPPPHTTQEIDTKFSFPTNIQEQQGQEHENENKSTTSTTNAINDRLLTIPEIWEYLNDLIQNDCSLDIDPTLILHELKLNKNLGKCNGQGHSYQKSLIDSLISKHLQK
ncbi:bZIP transcription factor NDAI_0K02070 [Naumovozyma dairenensis CBS 421]|uniref:BZIP domain-containing protein n=1 Tax=Naumovozyma dairenensis (strain ATCC 10597 / BCRC 20456 / CBS 421 / NBRC 0211 / NRRL Y-12639) TaxID=1071378 RepID=G0WHY7_NAUDC|nr:hypothetical protein NDAI_0K02070 [Naumovozyma dairenensis CBS 421]CCD27398.1 hypothetical protein NDAI_0K02070 [Naumovozyma dairenensis CBS 421]